MRRHNVKGIKSPVSAGMGIRPRNERHGKPLADVFIKPEVVKVNRGVRVNPQTGEAEVYSERVVLSPRRPMTPAEIAHARDAVVRALHPTTNHAKSNTEGQKEKK
jgi:hypothetical protein